MKTLDISCEERNWSDLFEDLLVVIAGKFNFVEDIFAFCWVCVSWRSAAFKEIGFVNEQACRLPWLLLAEKLDGVVKNKMVFPFGRGKLYDTNVIPSNKFKIFCLGWKGWVLVCEDKNTIYLRHAFVNKTRIELPSLRSLRHHNRFPPLTPVRRATLSSNPFTNPLDYMVAIIYGGYGYGGYSRLAFWRCGEKSYTKINVEGPINDVIFHDSLLYVVTHLHITVVDITGTNLTIQREIVVPQIHNMNTHRVVELDGDLVILMQAKPCDEDEKIVTMCSAFTLSELGDWIEINDFRNRAIFVGINQSFALDNAFEISGCLPNHIYFTENYELMSVVGIGPQDKHPMDGGAYIFTNNTVVGYSHCCRDEDENHCSRLWLQPTFL